ncbi:MAG: cysteine desulfurase family protein [Methylovulum sp.]|jgi:cysteine desulfurase
MIYLDNNATTALDERVLESMLPFLSTHYGNPSSLYRQGRIARSALDTAREQIAHACSTSPNQIIFTSGGTESNHLALNSLSPKASLAISAIEHPSILEQAQILKRQGISLQSIGVSKEGVITPTQLESIFAIKPPDLISIMHGNNETGVIQDIRFISEQCKALNVKLHTDASQTFGKIPVSFSNLGVDFMTISSHKIYGPKGCGALLYTKQNQPHPMLYGGGQEQQFRAGTENVAAIVGFGKAAELAYAELQQRYHHTKILSQYLETKLSTIPGMTIFGHGVERLPNTIQFSIDNINGEMLLMKLDQKGIAVSSGSACANNSKSSSKVIIAMGYPVITAESAIRVSFGKNNTEQEVALFFETLLSLLNTL